MERELICPVCGKTFTTTSWNAKYCSARCQVKGYRHKVKAAADQEEATEVCQDSFRRKRVEYDQEKSAREELETAAAAGDPFSRMKLAKRFSTDYWEAYSDYLKQYDDQHNTRSQAEVNGISIYDDQFADKVLQTIAELGCIYEQNKIEQRGTENAQSKV